MVGLAVVLGWLWAQVNRNAGSIPALAVNIFLPCLYALFVQSEVHKVECVGRHHHPKPGELVQW